jgi:hypothetical protein
MRRVLWSVFSLSLSMASVDVLKTSNTAVPQISSVCQHPQAQDGTCYGQQLKQKYFLLDANFTNLNHGKEQHEQLTAQAIEQSSYSYVLGSFGTIPKPVVQRQFEYVSEVIDSHSPDLISLIARELS